jgi:hypothetical protein
MSGKHDLSEERSGKTFSCQSGPQWESLNYLKLAVYYSLR